MNYNHAFEFFNDDDDDDDKESSKVKVQTFNMGNNITCTINCNYRISATL
jgi:hypothetical protein